MARTRQGSEHEPLDDTTLKRIDDLCELWSAVLRRRDAYARSVREQSELWMSDEIKLEELNRALVRHIKRIPRDLYSAIWDGSAAPKAPGKLASSIRELGDAENDDFTVMRARPRRDSQQIEWVVDTLAKWWRKKKEPSLDDDTWRNAVFRCRQLVLSGKSDRTPPAAVRAASQPHARDTMTWLDELAPFHAYLAKRVSDIGQKHPKRSAATCVGELLGRSTRYVELKVEEERGLETRRKASGVLVRSRLRKTKE